MKLLRTLRPAPILAAALGLCMAGYLALWPAYGYATDRQLPIYCVDRPEKVCAISFDAAWGADNTQGILDVLGRYNVKATFFVVGNWADQYPQQAKAIVESGCELMNHSNAHGHFNAMSTEEIVADVNTCNDKIEALTGVRPTLIRCPFGEYDDHVITAIRSIGMEPIQWDVDSLDWKGISAAEITQRVTGKVGPGSIVLFHNAGEHTPEALPGILDYLLAQGYQVVPISEILLDGEYTIDHTGRQFAAEGQAEAAPGGTAEPGGSGSAGTPAA